MGVLRSVSGTVKVRIVSADISGVLEAVHKAGIPAYNIYSENELTLILDIFRRDFRRLRKLLSSKDAGCGIVSRMGAYWALKSLLGRPVLLILVALLFAASVYLPGRVLFIRVEGNCYVSQNQILAEAERCGIGFGVSRRGLRSERIKNGLLSALPQLEWVGINTRGCVAVISVRERPQPVDPAPEYTVGSIRAQRDGIIVSCTATRGNLLCRVGQAVSAGEVLISGYTDCGLSICATRAEGEIFALTQHRITLKKPSEYCQQAQIAEVSKKYSLILGKNKINFYKDSGISAGSCDKMYLEYTLMLPGGFYLPVKLVEETWIGYTTETWNEAPAQAAAVMEQLAEDYLLSHAVACRILSAGYTPMQTDTGFGLIARFACCESIGQLTNEEIIVNHG